MNEGVGLDFFLPFSEESGRESKYCAFDASLVNIPCSDLMEAGALVSVEVRVL